MSFFDVITHSAASNATMVDSDGLLKWRPHNLALNSETFSGAYGSNVSVENNTTDTVAPDGNSTAAKFTATATSAKVGEARGGIYNPKITFGIFAKAGTCGYIGLGDSSGAPYAIFNLSSGAIQTDATGNSSASITPLGNGWYLCKISPNAGGSFYCFWGDSAGTSTGWTANSTNVGETYYVWGIHTHRSDLGGMVNNPDRGDSYVPTTTSAVYLPRRGHHVYNGSAWVNEGLLHESEARTNLFDGSATPATSWQNFANASLVANSATSPDGETNATLIQGSSAGGTGVVAVEDPVSISASVNNTYTVFLKANGASWAAIYGGNFTTSPGATYFNLVTGAVGTVGANVTGTHVESFGNGWWRVGVTFNPGADNVGVLRVLVTDADNSVTTALDGTATIYMYGPQVEAGSTPSSYIPTSGATVTRSAETLTVPAANLPWSSSAVSIQMQGEMTYAVENLSPQVLFYNWFADSSNYIKGTLSTTSGRTGSLYVVQESANVADAVLDDLNQYTPDILVPFNIASRHGSTFVNAAHEGVALTANTTPVSLPDLSATDLNLGNKFMGTISLFRIWADDIGDAGIAEAST